MSLFLSRDKERPSKSVLYLGFNQDKQCLAVGIEGGFRIFNCDPYKQTYKRDFSGGLGIVEMLFRCNILALVGGGDSPAWQPNKIILWDDNQKQPIGELSFKSEVKAVKLRKDRIIVVLEKFVYVYNFEKLERTHKFDSYKNKSGIVALSPIGKCVLAFPSTKKGSVRIEHLDSSKSRTIDCHDAEIVALTLSLDGTRLATASVKGTLIRIYDTITGNLLKELRRGSEKATIYCLSFNRDASMICCTSDKGTTHVFQTEDFKDETVKKKEEVKKEEKKVVEEKKDDKEKKEEKKDVDDKKEEKKDVKETKKVVKKNVEKKKGKKNLNRKSKLSIFGKTIPYLNSEWSFAWFRGPEVPSICCFGTEENTVLLMTADGKFYKLAYNANKSGECTEKKAIKFIQTGKKE